MRTRKPVLSRLVFIFLILCSTTVLIAARDEGSPVPTGFETATESEAVVAENRVMAPGKRLTDVLRNGGPLMIPILFCSFVLVVFTLERLISLRKGRIIPMPFASKFIEQVGNGTLNKAGAIEICEKDGSAIAHVFQAAAQKWGKSSVEVEQAVLDEGERQSHYMRRYLRLINGIATVCPLLGLLGTVLGMIHAFDAISSVDNALVDPKVMIATGISQALLTTAAGMTVAIPALIAYMFFSSRVDRRVMEIDSLGMQVVRIVCAESQPATRSKSSRKSAA